jgi:hypothetical protein
MKGPSSEKGGDKEMRDKASAKGNSTKGRIEQLTPVELRASATALPMPGGLFAFTVKGAQPKPMAEAGDLQFPALHVAPGPGCAARQVDFIGAPNSMGTWLFKPGDTLVVKVEEPGATLILSSVRSAGTQPLDVDVARIDGAKPALKANNAAEQPADAGDDNSLKLQLSLHVRNRGDLKFGGGRWAGQLVENLWIESFSLAINENLTSRDVEYKGLSANGFETPWLSDNAVCGTKGISLPLVGFALRLKPEAAAKYDCEYSGYFQSGATVGPVRNGVPCRSKVASDALVGMQLRIVPRTAAARPAATAAPTTAPTTGPRFSKFREAIRSVTKTQPPAPAKPATKKSGDGPSQRKK